MTDTAGTLFEQPKHDKTLVRTSDPLTSREGAKDRNDASDAAVVVTVMSDGIPRIDEEIHAEAVRLCGYERTQDRLRHGRRLAQKLGRIKLTGHRRPTSQGGASREWVIV